jgi:hypothetical protein
LAQKFSLSRSLALSLSTRTFSQIRCRDRSSGFSESAEFYSVCQARLFVNNSSVPDGLFYFYNSLLPVRNAATCAGLQSDGFFLFVLLELSIIIICFHSSLTELGQMIFFALL